MKTILLLTDFSKKAEHAAEFAFLIASKTGADIILYNAYYVPRTVPVVTEYPFYDEHSEAEKNNLKQLKTLTDYLTQKLLEEQEDFRPPSICHINEPGNLSDNIENIIQKKQPWMIIMGEKSRKNILSQFIFGSDTYNIVGNSVCPVIIVPEEASIKSLNQIALAIDLSKSDDKALHFLAGLASCFNAKIKIVDVSQSKRRSADELKGLEQFIKIRHKINYFNISYICVPPYKVSKALMQISENVDLLALVYKEPAFFDRFLQNNVTEDSFNYYNTPLLIIPET